MTRDPLNIGVRLTPELHAALSAEVSRRTAADPDAGWTLSSVARSILRVALLGRAAVPLDASPAEPPGGARTTAQPNARAELQPAPDGAQGTASPSVRAPVEAHRRQPPTTAGLETDVEVRGAAAQTSPAEPLCGVCGEGLWHNCTRKCGRRTRTCVCAESIARDGVCASCAQSPAPSVGLALTPPPGPRIAPDEVQDAARAEVLAWVAVDPKTRTRVALADVAGAKRANVLRWLAPGVRQRLPAAQIDAILAHVRGNP